MGGWRLFLAVLATLLLVMCVCMCCCASILASTFGEEFASKHGKHIFGEHMHNLSNVKVEAELQGICETMLALLNDSLIPKANEAELTVFFRKTKATTTATLPSSQMET